MRELTMKTSFFLLAIIIVPMAANAGVGRGEAAQKQDACEQAKAKAEATCASGHATQIGQCDCVERKTTLYLKNWRCAVEAKCETASSGKVLPERGATSPPH
jgi:hypothetical protein